MTGVVLRTRARCLAEGCDWVPLGSSWSEVDRAVERHVRAAGHAATVNTTYYPVDEDEEGSS